MTAVETAAETVKVGDHVRLTLTIYRDTDLRDLVASAGEVAQVTKRRGQILTLVGGFKEFEADINWVQRV